MLLRYVYLWRRHRRVDRFLAGTRHARQAQRDVLFSKIRRNEESDFGREWGFHDIHTVEDFRRRMPLTTYEDYLPYIERVKQGEISAMFGPGARVLMFALTSGTTDKAKYIPITDHFMEEYRRGWNLWGLRAYHDHRRLLRLLNLQLTSDWRQFYTEGGIPCGNISGLAAETAPLISRPIFVIPRALMKITDPLAKHYTALRLTMARRRVGVVMTANPSTLIEFAKLGDRRRESLIRDIYNGTLSDEVDVSSPVRLALKRRTSVRRPKRARELESIIERTGSLHPKDYWTRLQILAVWTGGSVGAYLPRLKEYFGDLPVRDHGLSASEGRITLPLEDNTSAGVLDYTSQYFEFIPEEEHGSDQPTVLEGHELQEGKKYFVILTTSSGFYRYDIHDLVECTGFEGEAPLLKFLNKGAHFSSVTGEKISEFQVSMAVQRGFEDLGLPFDLFTVAPRWGDPPGYVLLVEPGDHMARAGELAGRIDRHLGELNCEYEDRLTTRRLRPLEIQEIPAGVWAAFRSDRIQRQGGSMEQYKHPCLTNDFEFIQRLEQFGCSKPSMSPNA